MLSFFSICLFTIITIIRGVRDGLRTEFCPLRFLHQLYPEASCSTASCHHGKFNLHQIISYWVDIVIIPVNPVFPTVKSNEAVILIYEFIICFLMYSIMLLLNLIRNSQEWNFRKLLLFFFLYFMSKGI